MNKKKFIEEFKKAVPNFDDAICNFEFKKYDEVLVKFVLNSKLVCLKMYKSKYYIHLWKNHFIEYFDTGNFDYNGYWKFYDSVRLDDGSLSDFFIDDDIYKVPLCKKFGNDFYEHSTYLEKLLELRDDNDKDLGIKLITKPVNGEKIIELNNVNNEHSSKF